MGDQFKDQVKRLSRILFAFVLLLLMLFTGLFYIANNTDAFTSEEIAPQEIVEADDTIKNGIHLATGFVDDKGMQLTIQNCTGCHSAQLVTQNRMSREGWEATIKWMQETQNLWDLGANEEAILTYLSKNYAPKAKGRRQNLEGIEWYELE
ncbi:MULTISPECIES: monoheme cytochrome C [Flavobacteriaceae]|uniref:monoheme cytochrome C n=1 Tax=Flavobacteriaceae TaxID=49546 RepID=UPI001490D6EF|nr:MULTISPECIES: monoheme cytochrome C [Allomuricauda]MDC6366227.1 monoheme cytochrome C [Muricauda sp. AC10]